MKFVVLFTTLIGFQFARATILCKGVTESEKTVTLKIQDTGKKDRRGFKLVNVTRLFSTNMGTQERPVQGCNEAVFAGLQNRILVPNYSGSLYVECDGDGDAGYMNLGKVSVNKYQGTVFAPNGQNSLDMSDEEEMTVSCIVTK